MPASMKSAKAAKPASMKTVKKGSMKVSTKAMKTSTKGSMKSASSKAKKVSMKMKKKAAKKVSMKKRAMKKVNKVGKKRSVFNGTAGKERTGGGLKQGDLMKAKNGKIVSKKASDAAKRRPSFQKILLWNKCLMQARKELSITGMVPCGGQSQKGQQLLAKTRTLYAKRK